MDNENKDVETPLTFKAFVNKNEVDIFYGLYDYCGDSCGSFHDEAFEEIENQVSKYVTYLNSFEATPAPISEQKQEGETLIYVASKKTLVDLPEDFAGDYFGEIHHDYDGDKTIEVEQFFNSDARVSFLVVDNKIEATVFERRTALNNVEVFYCRKSQKTAKQIEEKDKDHQEALSAIGKQWSEKRELLKQIDQYKARIGELEAENNLLKSRHNAIG